MNILATAGNTQVPIDRVRVITNVFTGRTGTRIAIRAYERGHGVTLLTSHPDLVSSILDEPLDPARWRISSYRTFDDLYKSMESAVRDGGYDAVIHSAAVSDYQAGGIYGPAGNTHFDVERAQWYSPPGGPPTLIDQSSGKVKSDQEELWLRLIRAPKLIDLVRGQWRFRGVLVKFKLEVGVAEHELRKIAEQSRQQSKAELMVANTLDEANEWAIIGPIDGDYLRVSRIELADRLLDAVENLRKERNHG
jgi:phosphopantothenoylcysteine synthetase/decarboxylase